MKWIAVFALLILWGCGKDNSVVPPPVEPPINVVPTAQLSILPSGGVLPYGTEVTIAWTTSNATSVTLNGKVVGANGSQMTKLFANTAYTLIAFDGVNTKNDLKSVTIGDWTTSNIGLLTGKPWRGLLKTQIYTDGILVSEPVLSDGQINRPFYFTLGGDVIDSQSGGLICKWELKDSDQTLVMGPTYKLVSLTQTRLVRSSEITYASKPSVCVNTYWRE